ncbi:MAG: ABC transporter permease, partial [Bdellovibrionota bacterium]
LVAIFLGAGAMPRELERRTIHVALSRPISRPQFVIGKFSGLAAVLFLNWALLCGAFLTILAFSGDGLSGNFHLVTAWALFCIFLQSIVIASIAMVFSTFSTTSLSAMIAIGFYLIGNNIAQLRAVSARTRNPVTVAVLDGLTAVLPNFEYFNLSTKVTYGIPVGWKFGVVGFLYALLLTSLALGMSGFFIQRREV